VSESHPEFYSQKRGEGVVRGDFFTQNKYAFSPSVSQHIDTGWRTVGLSEEERYIYDGPFYIGESTYPAGGIVFPDQQVSSNAQLDVLGTTAIARCAPAEPTANLLTALAETYHDGLPHLIGRETWEKRITIAQSLHNHGRVSDGLKSAGNTAGSEFLNYQFGWLPLVSDVSDFVKTVIHLNKLVQQYIRDNGKVVRRRYYFPPVFSDVTSSFSSPSWPGGPKNYGGWLDTQKRPQGEVQLRRQTSVNRWFSGAFIYHLPQTFFAELYSDHAAQFQTVERLFGLELTPDVLWELTPWSWAVDWFSNVGDVIHNANAWASGGLVMKYGYIMEHSIVHDTYTFVGPTNIVGGSTVRPPALELVVETKQRRKATPFGFGLTMGGLNATQKSILAALGLSRLR